MHDRRYHALTRRSQAIHRNKLVLPVAVWLLEAGPQVVKTPEIVRGLEGRLQNSQVLLALDRLCKIEAVGELPHVGAPHPRNFEILGGHPYWPFVEAIATHLDRELGDSVDMPGMPERRS